MALRHKKQLPVWTLQARRKKACGYEQSTQHIVQFRKKAVWTNISKKLMSAVPAQRKLASESEKSVKVYCKTGKAANGAETQHWKNAWNVTINERSVQSILGCNHAIKDGFTNLCTVLIAQTTVYQCCGGSLETLKNSLATAFAPILSVVAPILSKFIDMLSTAASYVGMFFSFLSGKSTYTKSYRSTERLCRKP